MVKLAALWLPLVLVLVSSFGIDIQAECHGTIHGGATVKNGGSERKKKNIKSNYVAGAGGNNGDRLRDGGSFWCTLFRSPS